VKVALSEPAGSQVMTQLSALARLEPSADSQASCGFDGPAETLRVSAGGTPSLYGSARYLACATTGASTFAGYASGLDALESLLQGYVRRCDPGAASPDAGAGVTCVAAPSPGDDAGL
jgi:hypothetical protein